MAESTDHDSLGRGREVVVTFMENNLREYHPYFEDPPVRFEKQSGRYVDVPFRPPGRSIGSGCATQPASPVAHNAAGSDTTAQNPSPGTKPELRVYDAMTFWNMIFPSAMKEFQSMTEAKPPNNPTLAYDIRSDKSWADAYDKLEKAQDEYTQKTGIRGGFRRFRRWIADKATAPAKVAIQVVPQMDIVTPVLGAVKIILDAVEKGAEIRSEALGAFDDLEDVFSDVEMFLGTFREEGPIVAKAVTLVAHVLLAMERCIVFFTRPDLRRGLDAVIKGKEYEKPLLDSLTNITSRSKKLMAEAVKTHIRDFSRYSQASRHIFRLIQDGQEDIAVAVLEAHVEVKQVAENTSKVLGTANAINAQLQLLLDKHDQEKEERERAEMKRKEQEEWERKERDQMQRRYDGLIDSKFRQQEQTIAQLSHLVTRSISQQPPSLLWAHPPHADTPYLDQERLWILMNIDDIDEADMLEIENKAKQLPLQHRARTEQIVNDHTFQDWIVCSSSVKLLIYGNFSAFKVDVSALSLFCTTLARTFRARDRCLCLVWFCGCHLGWQDESDADTSESEDSSDDELGWNFVGEDDYDPRTGLRVIKRMMRSLIAQLLCDYDFVPRHRLPRDIGLALDEKGYSLSQLRRLFAWLVRQLPRDVTLFCLLDGIFLYEREGFEDPMLDVLGDILELTVSDDVSAVVKVLVTSPRPPCTVRVGFEDDEIGSGDAREATKSILSMDLLTPSNIDVSEERVIRSLGGNS